MFDVPVLLDKNTFQGLFTWLHAGKLPQTHKIEIDQKSPVNQQTLCYQKKINEMGQPQFFSFGHVFFYYAKIQRE